MYKYAFSSKIVNKTICNSEKARLIISHYDYSPEEPQL